MPYIKTNERQLFDSDLNEIIYALRLHGWEPGHFNYIVSRIANSWFKDQRRYATANAIIGAFECAKQEFYRKQIAPYEEEKIKEHGDI